MGRKDTSSGQKETVPLLSKEALKDKTAGQVAAMGRKAQHLLDTKPRVAKACFSMVSSFQLYNTAVMALDDELLSLRVGGDAHGLAYILTESMKKMAAKEFTREQLMGGIQQNVLEFLTMELAIEREREEKARQEEEEVKDQHRHQLLIPVGLAVSEPQVLTIGRRRSVVVVGQPSILGDVLHRAVTAALDRAEGRHVVVIWLKGAPREERSINLSDHVNKQLLEVGAQYWANAATGKTKLKKHLQGWLKATHKNRVDLLVVEDLGKANDPGGAMPLHIRAAQAQQNIRRAADELSCAVLAGLPIQEEIDPSAREWRDLEVYTELRFVREGKEPEREMHFAERGGDSWPAIPAVLEGNTNGSVS